MVCGVCNEGGNRSNLNLDYGSCRLLNDKNTFREHFKLEFFEWSTNKIFVTGILSEPRQVTVRPL